MYLGLVLEAKARVPVEISTHFTLHKDISFDEILKDIIIVYGRNKNLIVADKGAGKLGNKKNKGKYILY